MSSESVPAPSVAVQAPPVRVVRYGVGTSGYRQALSVIRTFETGSPQGGYSALADHASDRGGLSFGWYQAADAPDILDRLVSLYISKGGVYAGALAQHLEALRQDKGSGNVALKGALVSSASDPLMREAQDELFHELYGKRAYLYASVDLGLVSPLGFAVVLDSFVQGTRWSELRNRFAASPPSKVVPVGADGVVDAAKQVAAEREWLVGYLRVRREWLAAQTSLASKTVYRPDTFLGLVSKGNWDLVNPVVVKLGNGEVTIR